jgi:hypothetical protein
VPHDVTSQKMPFVGNYLASVEDRTPVLQTELSQLLRATSLKPQSERFRSSESRVTFARSSTHSRSVRGCSLEYTSPASHVFICVLQIPISVLKAPRTHLARISRVYCVLQIPISVRKSPRTPRPHLTCLLCVAVSHIRP